MKSILYLLFFVSILFVTSCTAQTSDTTDAPPPVNYSTISKTYSVEAKGPDIFDGEIAAYSDGIIGIPNGKGSFPLVLILYGVPSEETSFIQEDYDFYDIVERLARNGYAAISINISSIFNSTYGDRSIRDKANAIVDSHMQLLQAANEGSLSFFGINMIKKIDFSKIGLCGYARGGDLIFDVALDQQEKYASEFALLPISPVKSVDVEKKAWPKGQVSILISASDGTDNFQDGLAIDTLIDAKTESLHSTTIILDSPDPLTIPKQRNFVMHYALDFFNAALKGQTKETIYAPDAPTPTQMYGFNVLCRLGKNGKRVLVNADMPEYLTADSCMVRIVQDSWYYADDQVSVDTLTFGNYGFKQRKLLQIKWESIDASLSLKPENKDLRGYSILSLRMITDPLDSLNQGLIGQNLTIMLKDGKGNSSAVTLPGCPNSLLAAPCPQGSSTEFVTPLMSTDIPLAEFRHVALNDIVSVELRFDQSNSGSIYLERALLQ